MRIINRHGQNGHWYQWRSGSALKQKEDALKNANEYKMYIGDDNGGDRGKCYAYTHDGRSASTESNWDVLGNDLSFALDKAEFKMTNSIKKWMSEILEVVFQAAALCINTLRIFQLIILAILGPLVFGIAVFDGFQHTLTVWIARYINIFLWLPVCNIFGR